MIDLEEYREQLTPDTDRACFWAGISFERVFKSTAGIKTLEPDCSFTPDEVQLVAEDNQWQSLEYLIELAGIPMPEVDKYNEESVNTWKMALIIYCEQCSGNAYVTVEDVYCQSDFWLDTLIQIVYENEKVNSLIEYDMDYKREKVIFDKEQGLEYDQGADQSLSYGVGY